MPLPPNVSPSDFDAALSDLRKVVGRDYVFIGEETDSYLDPYSPTDNENYRPSAAVAPKTVEEVQGCLDVANKYSVPMWPISTGKNLAYGGASPAMAGTMVLDLKRMNRIIEVNEEDGYALVEPGVSYFDLYNYLQANNIKLWIDCPSPGWGSVIGNALERGVGYTPYGDHWLMQCGLEVVLADGDVVRTGMGAASNNKAWQLFKYGFGPYMDGMFTQSNYGVVTKMGIWLMPEPPGYSPYMVTFEKEEDLHQVVEIIRPLRLNNVIPNAAVLCSNFLDLAISKTRSDIYTGKGPVPMSVQKRVNKEHRIGMWNFYGAVYGPPPIMDLNLAVLRDAFAQVPGSKFYMAEERAGEPAPGYRFKSMQGIPHLTEFTTNNWYGAGGAHFDFVPVSPVRGKDATAQYELIRDDAHKSGRDYLGEFVVGWRDMHHVYWVIFNSMDPENREEAKQHYLTVTRLAAEQGYACYRTHLHFMNEVDKTFDYNDHSLSRLQHRLKAAMDPNGILAPGKSGIWPDKYKDLAKA